VAEPLPDPAAREAREGKRLLVVGCGNPLAGDDGVGAEVVRRLDTPAHADCDFLVLPFAGIELLEVLLSAEAVLVIDAVSSGAPPGTLHLIPWPTPSVASRLVSSVSSHGWGVAEALALAEALGRPLPPVTILGIETGEVRPGAPRSAAVEAAVERIVEKFAPLCSRLIASPSPLRHGVQSFLPGDSSFPGC
jgi:hydrogenase maturation protease